MPTPVSRPIDVDALEVAEVALTGGVAQAAVRRAEHAVAPGPRPGRGVEAIATHVMATDEPAVDGREDVGGVTVELLVDDDDGRAEHEAVL